MPNVNVTRLYNIYGTRNAHVKKETHLLRFWNLYLRLLFFENEGVPYNTCESASQFLLSYTRSVASKIFNYKASLQQLDYQGLSQNTPPCNCSDSRFLYAPCGHIVTGDLNIVRNTKLRDLLSEGPKYRFKYRAHINGNRTFALTWMHVKSMPDSGKRKKTSKSTLFRSGSSRLPMF